MDIIVLIAIAAIVGAAVMIARWSARLRAQPGGRRSGEPVRTARPRRINPKTGVPFQ